VFRRGLFSGELPAFGVEVGVFSDPFFAGDYVSNFYM
jgi:hypothetical protein